QAHGEDPDGDPVDSNESDATITSESDPGLSIVKSADKDSYSEVGEVITYTFVVENTGNVTVSDIDVQELDFSGSGVLSPVVCPADTTLAPGESLECTATYEVTQADIDAGKITNAAYATGTPPDPDDPPVETPPDEEEVPADKNPELTLVKTADPTTVHEAGDTVAYSFEVTNTGNVTVDNLSITEVEFTGTGQMSSVTCPV